VNRKGFTLIELLVALGILAALAAIAIPMYRGYQKSAARQEAFTNLQGLSLCAEQYFAENGRYVPSGDLASLPEDYDWAVNDAGTVTTDNFASWLPCFQPKKGSGGAVNKYSYRLTVTNSTVFNAIAMPQRRPVTGDGDITLDYKGDKTGNWPK
jgi:prepilin-type N-terminal cleavage/methylation domain-containing protein